MATTPKALGRPTEFGALEKLVRKPGKWPARISAKSRQMDGVKVYVVNFAEKHAAKLLEREHLARQLFIGKLANEAFGDKKLAAKFMTTHHRQLKATPLEKLQTEWGGRQVERLLNSMIYGLPA